MERLRKNLTRESPGRCGGSNGLMPSRWLAGRGSVVCLCLWAALASPIRAQQSPERFWLAGRYDGDRIIVYFDAVKFGTTTPSDVGKIAPPVADLFFNPEELPARYIAGFQQSPKAERFAIGDRYDLLKGDGTTATVKLTNLVGFLSDEQVDNDSYIGALATPEPPDSLTFTRAYYAVRRHSNTPPWILGKFAGLVETPVRFDVEARIATLLDQRMKTEATAADRSAAAGLEPALIVQPFRVADGSMRYYARAVWKTGKETPQRPPYSIGAWISPVPAIHIMAGEPRTSPYGDFGLPEPLNVVDLGAGRTGIIVDVEGLDSRELNLFEYRDGASIKQMRLLQSIGVGE